MRKHGVWIASAFFAFFFAVEYQRDYNRAGSLMQFGPFSTRDECEAERVRIERLMAVGYISPRCWTGPG